MRTCLLPLLIVVALFAIAAQAQRRECDLERWNFCELADFGPYFVKDDTGMPWAISIIHNMTCPSSVYNKNGILADFNFAAGCYNSPIGGSNAVLGAYGLHSPKVFSYTAPGQSYSGAMIRIQSVSSAYPEYKDQYNLLNIVINCNKDIKGAPRDLSMVAPTQVNEPYVFLLSHSSSCF